MYFSTSDLEQQLDARRGYLADAATDTSQSTAQLSKAVGRIAWTDGALYAHMRLIMAAAFVADRPIDMFAEAQTAALDMYGYGADDTWSGRENDTARARFDGLREQIARDLSHRESLLAEADAYAAEKAKARS